MLKHTVHYNQMMIELHAMPVNEVRSSIRPFDPEVTSNEDLDYIYDNVIFNKKLNDPGILYLVEEHALHNKVHVNKKIISNLPDIVVRFGRTRQFTDK